MIQYGSINLSTYATVDPLTVLSETPGAWDSVYMCNTQLVEGVFTNPLGNGTNSPTPLRGQTYSLLADLVDSHYLIYTISEGKQFLIGPNRRYYERLRQSVISGTDGKPPGA
jgi:hypothetical protein